MSRRVLEWIALGLLCLYLLFGALLALSDRYFPYPIEELSPALGGPLLIEDRHGQPLRVVSAAAGRAGRGEWTPLDRVASHAVLTLLASEDQRFFEHAGVDGLAVLRAICLDVLPGSQRYGASTLTMQLVKNLHSLGQPRGLRQKLRETLQAVWLERSLDKRQILEQYLNRVYYGHGAYGIDAAARRYFGKPARALSVSEATLLSVLPRNPSLYDPLRHLDRALERRDHLLRLLVEQHRLGPAEAARAQAQPLGLALHAWPFEAAHFVDHVLAELPEAVRSSGGRLRTTLDLELQRRLEHQVRAHLAELDGSGASDAALVVLDSQSGEVLALVGSADYAAEGGQLNLVTRRRHPGSALKPFVYAAAIEQGDHPGSVALDVFDDPAFAALAVTPGVERGPVRYREALAGSYNFAAMHTLQKVGAGRVLDALRRASVGALDGAADDYGPRLALGAAKVRLLDLAAGYGFLVRDGRARPARTLLELVAHGGEAVAVPALPERRVFSPETAWLTLDMLADPEARRPGFGDELAADLPYPVAVKTGTARGFADTVALFVTRELTVAAWTGRSDGAPTEGLTGMRGPAWLARSALLLASDGVALTLPAPPAGLGRGPVCALSGLRAAAACPHAKLEWFAAGHGPKQDCDWHVAARGPGGIRLPAELDAWARRHGVR
jgi:penicillin-binding protein 1C